MGKPTDKPNMVAFPDDGFIALEIPKAMIPQDLPANATGYLIRFRSAEGFKALVVSAMEAASIVWPEIAQEWLD